MPATPPLCPLTWFSAASMMCGCTPMSAILVAAVRRRSCSVHGFAEAGVEIALGAPSSKAKLGALAEQLITLNHARDGRDDVDRHPWQRQRVRSPVLAPRGRQCPRPRVHVDLAPAHAADLGAALSRQQQQLDDAADIVVTADAPERDDLRI